MSFLEVARLGYTLVVDDNKARATLRSMEQTISMTQAKMAAQARGLNTSYLKQSRNELGQFTRVVVDSESSIRDSHAKTRKSYGELVYGIRDVSNETDKMGKKHDEVFDRSHSKARILAGALGNIGGAMIGVGAIAGIGFLASEMQKGISLASSLQQAISGVKAVFGELEGQKLIDWAEANASNYLLTTGRALDIVRVQGSKLSAAGVDSASAAKMSKDLVPLIADLASFNDVPMERAIEITDSALAGEIEPGRRRGLLLSDSTMKAYAISSGIVKAETDQAAIQKALVDLQKARAKFDQLPIDQAEAEKKLTAAIQAQTDAQTRLRMEEVALQEVQNDPKSSPERIKKATDDVRKAKERLARAEEAVQKLSRKGDFGLEYKEAEATIATLEARVKKLTEGKVPEMTEEQKVLARQGLFVEQMKLTKQEGDLARTRDEYANQVNLAKANRDTFRSELGQTILPMLEKALQDVNDIVMPTMIEWVRDNSQAMQDAFMSSYEWVKGKLPRIGEQLSNFFKLFEDNLPGLINALEALGKGLETVGGWALTLIDVFQKLPEDMQEFIAVMAILQFAGVFKGLTLIGKVISEVLKFVPKLGGFLGFGKGAAAVTGSIGAETAAAVAATKGASATKNAATATKTATTAGSTLKAAEAAAAAAGYKAFMKTGVKTPKQAWSKPALEYIGGETARTGKAAAIGARASAMLQGGGAVGMIGRGVLGMGRMGYLGMANNLRHYGEFKQRSEEMGVSNFGAQAVSMLDGFTMGMFGLNEQLNKANTSLQESKAKFVEVQGEAQRLRDLGYNIPIIVDTTQAMERTNAFQEWWRGFKILVSPVVNVDAAWKSWSDFVVRVFDSWSGVVNRIYDSFINFFTKKRDPFGALRDNDKEESSSGKAPWLTSLGFANGGLLRGPGSGTSDSIPLWGSNGEYILNKRTVDRIGVNTLDALNFGKARGFATGGSVGSTSRTGSGVGVAGLSIGSVTVVAQDTSKFEREMRAKSRTATLSGRRPR